MQYRGLEWDMSTHSQGNVVAAQTIFYSIYLRGCAGMLIINLDVQGTCEARSPKSVAGRQEKRRDVRAVRSISPFGWETKVAFCSCLIAC